MEVRAELSAKSDKQDRLAGTVQPRNALLEVIKTLSKKLLNRSLECLADCNHVQHRTKKLRIGRDTRPPPFARTDQRSSNFFRISCFVP